VAIEDFSLQFLRPGHPSVDACRELLGWDDRGRAFAMWRPLPGAKHLRIAFRCMVHVSVDLDPVRATLEENQWDAIHQGGLLRMVRGWFPEFITELFVDENGAIPPAAVVEACRRPYDNRVDRNLGKERAAYVREALGTKTWRDMCISVAEKTLNAVRDGEELARAREHAQREATEYFTLMHARIGARMQAEIKSAKQAALQQEEAIENLVQKILTSPVVRLDTIGAYFLSEKPFWNQPK
jgi:ATP-dependent helicase HepA